MAAENTFVKGAMDSLYNHPHSQLTYIVSGKFAFAIWDDTVVVTAGDTLVKENRIVHGCVCLEDRDMVDFFTPMRKDFAEERQRHTAILKP